MSVEEPRLQDIPSIQKIKQDAKNFKAIKTAMPILGPILKLLGADVERIKAGLSETDELEQTALKLATIPDRFNDLFTPRGWIIYDLMKLEVAESAIQKADAGDIDGAEADLVNYYSPETIRWKLRTMTGLDAFRSRMPLAQKALIDYQEERYHACVPVVLALMDGLVNELHEKRRGMFADDVNLEAWDSIAAHSKGLNQLVRLFTKMRQKTTTEPITIPYRNGIMHGMDVGYDNKIVAAKTWAALFAVRDWAIKAERGLLVAPPEEPPKTWRAIIETMRRTEETKKLLASWQPREIQMGQDIPITGAPKSYENGSPEQKLAEFLSHWATQNYGFMAKCISIKYVPYPAKELPARVREIYATRQLQVFEFAEICDSAPSITDIETELVYQQDGNETKTSVRYILVCEDADGDFSVRGMPGSHWSIMNWEKT